MGFGYFFLILDFKKKFITFSIVSFRISDYFRDYSLQGNQFRNITKIGN
jgi:hypothetical protein